MKIINKIKLWWAKRNSRSYIGSERKNRTKRNFRKLNKI